jgi:hypothetical protein
MAADEVSLVERSCIMKMASRVCSVLATYALIPNTLPKFEVDQHPRIERCRITSHRCLESGIDFAR